MGKFKILVGYCCYVYSPQFILFPDLGVVGKAVTQRSSAKDKERLQEQRILASLRDEGLISRQVGKASGGVCFEVSIAYGIWASWRLRSSANWLFVQELVHGDNKANIKAPHHWAFVRSPADSPHKGPVMWEAFPCHAVIMCTELKIQGRMNALSNDFRLYLLTTFECSWTHFNSSSDVYNMVKLG